MGAPLSPYCHSCGYYHKAHPGASCKQKRWHKPFADGIELSDQERFMTTHASYVPNWVRARLRVEATKRGVTAGKLSSEILEIWAANKSGRP